MVFIEIIREYKCCWRVGQRREVSDEFAHVLIEGGYARKIEPPEPKTAPAPSHTPYGVRPDNAATGFSRPNNGLLTGHPKEIS